MAARYSEIEEYIMNKIHTGEWPIGYKIPKEVELCEQFGVSRSTVRTAMLRMVQDGHLKRVKRKGTFVTAPRVLEDTTVFIESFFNEMFRRGIEVETEVLEFRYMEMTEELAKKFENGDSRVIKLSRLRYVTEASLTKALNDHSKNRFSLEKEMTARPLESRESHLMGMKENALAMLISSVTRNEEGQIIEISESIYPLERNKFVWKLKL